MEVITRIDFTHQSRCRWCKEIKPDTEFPPKSPHRLVKGPLMGCLQCRGERPRFTNAIRSSAKRVARANKDGDGGEFTAGQWAGLRSATDYTCLRCGKKEPEISLTVDHIIPISKGGSSEISNIQPLCGPCNAAKQTDSTDYRTPLIMHLLKETLFFSGRSGMRPKNISNHM